MSMDIRIDGIYDHLTVKKLKQVGVRSFGVDFRPKSFNFLQGYAFLKILKESYQEGDQYILHFENEKDFVVQKIIQDLKNFLLNEIGRPQNLEDFSLLFSDFELPSYAKNLPLKFFWHYNPEVSLKKVLEVKNLKGIRFDFSFFQKINTERQLQNFVRNFYTQVLPLRKNDDLELILNIDWDSNIFSGLFEFLDFSSLSLAINHKVEICYRNVDYNLALDHIRCLNPFDSQ